VRLATLAAIAVALLLTTPVGPWLAIAALHGYQRTLAPLVGRAGVRCRFTPTCSHYAEVVIARDGLALGGWKAAKRVARCGPWTPTGTVDQP